MARAKLSLLWDEKTSSPVLFLERLYTQGKFEQQCEQAITQMAIAKATALGLPLISVAAEDGYTVSGPWDTDLVALGSNVSQEYSDGTYGLQPNGEYRIHNKRLSRMN